VGRDRGAKGARERQQTSPLTRLCVGGWRGRVGRSRGGGEGYRGQGGAPTTADESKDSSVCRGVEGVCERQQTSHKTRLCV
jgi:hypothetical protein